MVQADGGPPAPEPASSPGPAHLGPSRLLPIAITAGVVVGALVTALIFVAVRHDGTAAGTSSSTTRADSGTAMCAAIPVANQVLPSIVTISARGGAQAGTGSGQVFREGGYILTNDHVISVAANGGSVSVQYSDGHSSDAAIIGRDPSTDLAVLKASDGAKDYPVIGFGSSGALQIGQPVVALGAPLGLASTVTSGIVSALDRYVPVPGDGVTHHLIGAIQTDAAINPGNSGGALVDCAGRLVGVNAAIATVPNAAGVSGGGSVGLGFAIPIDLAKPIADELVRTGRPGHPTTGLQVQEIPPAAAKASGTPTGLFVLAVDAAGPAAKAGLRAGDIITKVDNEAAVSSEQIVVATLTRKAGDTLELTYIRAGTSATTKLTLAAA
ncbi:putative serine protease PepD [Kribbella voronezhensis]|uniref:Putative serine protease PepD n=1 Tax=Kribbella voronezhensis TaxID=2512212 RepID=A0A4R7SXE0_9ACTN|nr:trypsin-like peptidase domain-containing protein [Kribbella voronezhensis]TDU83336.1 putative serine protease PepD [Kribbella voronezhensis]